MPKTVDLGAKRAELALASLKVIAREGLGAASLRRIAAEAGCTTGQLTHYFASREALLIEALRTAHFAAGARMMAAAAEAPTPRARLAAVLAEALPLDALRLAEWRVWLAFWSLAPGDVDLEAENARRYGEWGRLLETLVAPFCHEAAATRRMASMVMALVDGLGVRLALMDEAGRAAALTDAEADLSAFIEPLTETAP